jgi:hypothetical protein
MDEVVGDLDSREGRRERLRRENVARDDLRIPPTTGRQLRGISGEAADGVALREQLRNEPGADVPGRPRDEDLHRTAYARRRLPDAAGPAR